MDPLIGTPYEGWTREELEARLEELECTIRETEEELAAAQFERTLEYLELEGFVEVDDGRIYPKDDACFVDIPPEN